MELSDPSVWGETYDNQFGMGPQGRKLGAFEISKFEFGVSASGDDPTKKGAQAPGARPTPGASSSGQAAATSKEPTLQNFKVSKHIDKASPDLFLACCKKNMIAWAIISVRETGELNRKPYLVLEFTNLHVVSFSWDLSPGEAAEAESAAAMETVEFDYETILIKYARQDLSGEHRVVKMKGWNRPLHNDSVGELAAELNAEQADIDGSALT
jgi:type VI secretion system Hcp family effector